MKLRNLYKRSVIYPMAVAVVSVLLLILWTAVTTGRPVSGEIICHKNNENGELFTPILLDDGRDAYIMGAAGDQGQRVVVLRGLDGEALSWMPASGTTH